MYLTKRPVLFSDMKLPMLPPDVKMFVYNDAKHIATLEQELSGMLSQKKQYINKAKKYTIISKINKTLPNDFSER